MTDDDSGYDAHIELLHDVLDRTIHILMQQLPLLKNVASQIIDTVFIPKIIGRQLMILIAVETGMATMNQVLNLIQYIFVSTFSSRHRLISQLEYRQRHVVSTQDEWMDLAERIDTIQGNDIWRSDPNCPLYERERIQARIDEYVHLMRRRDIFELMFLLRGSIGRNKFGLLHEGLFTKALAGSKVLTETYHNVVCAALDFVCDAPVLPAVNDPIPTDARLAFFNETRHAYGRTALLLSGGAALGFYHVGLVKALMENGLMPRVIGGSSAGSIVCAMIGTRTDQECMSDLFHVRGTNAPGHSGALEMNFFRPIQKSIAMSIDQNKDVDNRKQANVFSRVYYNTAGAFHDAKRTIQGFMPIPVRHFTSIMYDLVTGNTRPQDIFKSDTAHFRECLRTNVGNFTFQEAFDRTGRILNIVVTPNNSSDPPRLLNYLTAPHVLVWSAAVASSSLPGVFEANRLVVKEADGYERYESSGDGQVSFSDGSMEQDLPMQQLSEMFNINHFIISQANPHAVLFASYGQKTTTSIWSSNPVAGFLVQISTFLRNQLRSWLLNLVQCVGARRITPLFETQRGIGTQFFTQEYEGRPSDISLVPWLSHRSLFSALLHIIYNPSEAEFRDWIAAAERETWKHLPAIKSHIAEEVTLDRCVQRLRRRLFHEQQQQLQLTAVQGSLYHHHHQHHPLAAMAESNEDGAVRGKNKKEDAAATGRVPSFFTSHSLVNMSGLSIGDTMGNDDLRQDIIRDYAMPIQPVVYPVPPVSTVVTTGIVPSADGGWGGLGLRGNRSSGNLHRSTSDASGLFVDEHHHPQQQVSTQHDVHQQNMQHPGESTTADHNKTTTNPTIPNSSVSGVNNSNSAAVPEVTVTPMPSVPSATSLTSVETSGYVKTSSMARFYYRKAAVGEDYLRFQSSTERLPPRTSSESAMSTMMRNRNDNGNMLDEVNTSAFLTGNTRQKQDTIPTGNTDSQHSRRKSKSFADLEVSIR